MSVITGRFARCRNLTVSVITGRFARATIPVQQEYETLRGMARYSGGRRADTVRCGGLAAMLVVIGTLIYAWHYFNLWEMEVDFSELRERLGVEPHGGLRGGGSGPSSNIGGGGTRPPVARRPQQPIAAVRVPMTHDLKKKLAAGGSPMQHFQEEHCRLARKNREPLPPQCKGGQRKKQGAKRGSPNGKRKRRKRNRPGRPEKARGEGATEWRRRIAVAPQPRRDEARPDSRRGDGGGSS